MQCNAVEPAHLRRMSHPRESRDRCVIQEADLAKSLVGTPFYVAPEVASGAAPYSTAVDLYSFGIMIAEIVMRVVAPAGETPFPNPLSGECFRTAEDLVFAAGKDAACKDLFAFESIYHLSVQCTLYMYCC